MILPKSAQWPKPRVPSSQQSAACLVQVVPRACSCSCQQLQCRRGTGSEAAALTCSGVSPSPGEISKEEKSILPIDPYLKQVPAKPQISKPFSHERHHYYYRKQQPEVAGDPCPAPISRNKSTPGTVYFKPLPQEVTKMIV